MKGIEGTIVPIDQERPTRKGVITKICKRESLFSYVDVYAKFDEDLWGIPYSPYGIPYTLPITPNTKFGRFLIDWGYRTGDKFSTNTLIGAKIEADLVLRYKDYNEPYYTICRMRLLGR